jgi:SulP family sulfate permease
MRENGRILLVSEARKEAIRIFKNSGLFEVIGRENIFPDNLQNPTLPTAKALAAPKPCWPPGGQGQYLPRHPETPEDGGTGLKPRELRRQGVSYSNGS